MGQILNTDLGNEKCRLFLALYRTLVCEVNLVKCSTEPVLQSNEGSVCGLSERFDVTGITSKHESFSRGPKRKPPVSCDTGGT